MAHSLTLICDIKLKIMAKVQHSSLFQFLFKGEKKFFNVGLGHDIPHSHPPYDQHPVIDVATGAVLSNLDDQVTML
jgi:hypothetical protein